MNLVNCKLTLKNVLNKSTRLSKKESNTESEKGVVKVNHAKTTKRACVFWPLTLCTDSKHMSRGILKNL